MRNKTYHKVPYERVDGRINIIHKSAPINGSNGSTLPLRFKSEKQTLATLHSKANMSSHGTKFKSIKEPICYTEERVTVEYTLTDDNKLLTHNFYKYASAGSWLYYASRSPRRLAYNNRLVITHEDAEDAIPLGIICNTPCKRNGNDYTFTVFIKGDVDLYRTSKSTAGNTQKNIINLFNLGFRDRYYIGPYFRVRVLRKSKFNMRVFICKIQ